MSVGTASGIESATLLSDHVPPPPTGLPPPRQRRYRDETKTEIAASRARLLMEFETQKRDLDRISLALLASERKQARCPLCRLNAWLNGGAK